MTRTNVMFLSCLAGMTFCKHTINTGYISEATVTACETMSG